MRMRRGPWGEDGNGIIKGEDDEEGLGDPLKELGEPSGDDDIKGDYVSLVEEDRDRGKGG